MYVEPRIWRGWIAGRAQAASLSRDDFLDFSHAGGLQLRFLVFDGRFTTYACLKRLNQDGILFVTVRRRGRHLVQAAQAVPPAQRNKIRVPVRNGTRLLEVVESTSGRALARALLGGGFPVLPFRLQGGFSVPP